MIAKFDDGLSYYFFRDTAVLNIELNGRHNLVYNMFKEYFTHQTYRTEKRVKTSENNARKSNMAFTQWIVRARFVQHPSNKAMFIRLVVYTANAALMVG